jgi:hypothetical protein
MRAIRHLQPTGQPACSASHFQRPTGVIACCAVGLVAYSPRRLAGRTIEHSFQPQPHKEHSMGVMNDPLTNDLFTQALLPVML